MDVKNAAGGIIAAGEESPLLEASAVSLSHGLLRTLRICRQSTHELNWIQSRDHCARTPQKQIAWEESFLDEKNRTSHADWRSPDASLEEIEDRAKRHGRKGDSSGGPHRRRRGALLG